MLSSLICLLAFLCWTFHVAGELTRFPLTNFQKLAPTLKIRMASNDKSVFSCIYEIVQHMVNVAWNNLAIRICAFEGYSGQIKHGAMICVIKVRWIGAFQYVAILQ